jgi:hypothetical protein
VGEGIREELEGRTMAVVGGTTVVVDGTTVVGGTFAVAMVFAVGTTGTFVTGNFFVVTTASGRIFKGRKMRGTQGYALLVVAGGTDATAARR